MGAAAFIMMDFNGATYATIMGISAIPAGLYALAVYIMVDLEARRLRLTAFADPTAPTAFAVLKRQGYLLIAILVMIGALVDGRTPTTAAVWAIAALVLLLIALDPVNCRRILRVCWDAMAEAPRLVAAVTVACAVGGILVGIIGQTGLGLRLSGLILDAAGGHTLVLLLLTTVMGIVLGMGMPTSGADIIMAALRRRRGWSRVACRCWPRICSSCGWHRNVADHPACRHCLLCRGRGCGQRPVAHQLGRLPPWPLDIPDPLHVRLRASAARHGGTVGRGAGGGDRLAWYLRAFGGDRRLVSGADQHA